MKAYLSKRRASSPEAMENLDNPSAHIDAEIAEQKARVTSLALACALATIASATWYMWPALDGDAILFNRLGAVGLLLSLIHI